MVVDFKFAKASGFAALTVAWKGEWDEKRIRREFEAISAFAKGRKVRTGKWYFFEPGQGRFRAAIEVFGKARGEGRIHRQRFPASAVVRVEFDPDEVSPRVVYHGLNDYLKWRRKDKQVKSVGSYREVYRANPWSDRKAWASTCVEALVRR